MFTPPNQPSSSNGNGNGNGLFGASSRRRPGALPTRSSLSNSFSLTPARPQQGGWDDSFEFETSSVSFAHLRRRLSITEQGNRGIGQVSPRLRPGSGAGSGSRRGSTRTSTRTVQPSILGGTSGKGKEPLGLGQPSRVKSRLGHTTQTQTPDHVTRRTSPRKRQERQMVDETDTSMQVEDLGLIADELDSEDEEDEEVNWGMIDSMRIWRNDALMQHLYETASFWGDKILSWTGKFKSGRST
jgi:anaphase-promoting complex subunit 6